ncbi:MAG: PorV/PorQ family protein [candidate division WOR-3 bacterium]
MVIPALLLCFFITTVLPNAGNSGYLFLRINPDAYSSAIANSGVGKDFTKEASVFNFTVNPAYLVTSSKIGITYLNYLAGVQIGGLSYIQANPIPVLNSGGIGLLYLNSGTIKKTDEYGYELGSFTVSYVNLNILGSYEVVKEKLLVGANVKFLSGVIDSFTSLGLAGDFGVCWRSPLAGLSTGAVLKNFGLEVKSFNNTREELPLDVVLGCDYWIFSNAHILFELYKPFGNPLQFNIGGEYEAHRYLTLRLGYNSRGKYFRENSSDLLSGLSFGFGIHFARGQFDYSFVPMGSLGYTHNLTFSLQFRK